MYKRQDLQQYTNGSSNGDKQNGWQYAIRNQQLCRSKDGGNWKTVSQTTAEWFGILDGQVYYLHRTPNGIGVLYQVNDAGQDKRILKETVDAVAIQDGYPVSYTHLYGAMPSHIWSAWNAIIRQIHIISSRLLCLCRRWSRSWVLVKLRQRETLAISYS